jgi:hypothetical protein
VERGLARDDGQLAEAGQAVDQVGRDGVREVPIGRLVGEGVERQHG